MPLRVHVGLSKKLGMPSYGSVGASCDVEIELDGGLLQNDLDAFHRHVRNAFVACRQAVHDELSRYGGKPAAQANGHTASSHSSQEGTPSGNGASELQVGPIDEPPDGTLPGPTDPTPPRISQRQLDYASQLAGKIRGLGVRRLEAVASQMFEKPLADLSSLDGSSLIEMLKDIKAGKLELNVVLPGATA